MEQGTPWGENPNSTSLDLPWVEKYRPKQLDDMVGNRDTIGILKKIANEGMVNNLLLVGPPGVGKTSSIDALRKELLKEDEPTWSLELNASDERGIGVVRDIIYKFVIQQQTTKRDLKMLKNVYKIVILDECEK